MKLLSEQIAELGVVDQVPPVAGTPSVVSGECDSVEAQAALLLEAGFGIRDPVRKKVFHWSGVIEKAWMQNGQVWVQVKAKNPVQGSISSFSSPVIDLEKQANDEE
jgi:hypothetical protein